MFTYGLGGRMEEDTKPGPVTGTFWQTTQPGPPTPVTVNLPPLPISKPVRVYFELIRTLAALTAVAINALTLLRVFGKI